MRKPVYLLYGIADRDENELVAQFFESNYDLYSFVEALPGKYDVQVLEGIDYDAIKVVSISIYREQEV